MEGYSPCGLPAGKRPWKTRVAVAVAVALGVAVVVVAVALSIGLCQQATGSATAANASAGLARLEKLVASTNRSLAEALWQRDECQVQLGALEGTVSELEHARSRVGQLQEENRALKAEVAQQQKELEDLKSSWEEVEKQNQLLEKQLQEMWSEQSGGNRLLAVSFSLLALLLFLPGMLVL